MASKFGLPIIDLEDEGLVIPKVGIDLETLGRTVCYGPAMISRGEGPCALADVPVPLGEVPWAVLLHLQNHPLQSQQDFWGI